MQILTDRASDMTAAQMAGIDIHFVPMHLTLDGKTYSSGEDLSPAEFYDLLDQTEGFPTTSQPSAGIFAQLYRELAKTDPEILSIHISSGLSGTIDSARAGAAMVPEAKVTFWDSMTLSCPLAWQVELTARALQSGWSLERIFERLEKMRQQCEGIFTLDTMKYLIHGGRVSHLKGLLASVLQIKPIIAVDKELGKYYNLAQERTMKRALYKLAESVGKFHAQGTPLRVQLLHGKNPEAVEALCNHMKEMYDCHWTPTAVVGPILGAHTGGGLVGMSVGPLALFEDVPGIVVA
jgi:DegV family protein with EDD domain